MGAATRDVIDVVVGTGLEGTELEQQPPDAERLITEAVTIAYGYPEGGAELAALVSRYWRFVADEEMIGRTPEELVEATLSHWELARHRPRREARVQVTDDPANDHSLLEIVVDDMSFLVASVTGALTSRDLDVHLLVHPIMVVRRDPPGALGQVRPDVEPEDAGPGDLVESWIRVEFSRVADDRQLQEVRDALARVLADVRATADDWSSMRAKAIELAADLATTSLPVPDGDVSDAVELLGWLADDNFTFLGYRQYRLAEGEQGQLVLEAVADTGLGILRGAPATSRVLSTMTPEAYRRVRDKRLVIITKANSRATVRRPVYLDYIAFKTFNEAGEVTGECRFLGLFGSAAYRTSVAELPVVRRRVGEVIERVGLSPRSHSGRELKEILETYPRDDLFQVTIDDLYETVLGVLRLAGRRQVRLFLRRDEYGRFVSCLVYLPRDRFTTPNRMRIQEILVRELGGIGVDHTTRVSDSVLARLHFVVRTDPAGPPRDVDLDRLTQVINDATRQWDGDFRLVLERRLGRAEGKRLYHRYSHALPGSYKDEHDPYEAVKDIARMELMDQPGQLAMRVYRRHGDERDVRLRVLRYGEPMVLSLVLPVPHSFGLNVTDERPHEVKRADGTVYMYDFAVQLPPGSRPLVEVRPHLESAFTAAWRGTADIDGYNALVLTAGLTWRQVVVLRAYARYLHQTGTVYSPEYLEQTLVAYPDVAANLVDLFTTRFDPGAGRSDRAARMAQLVDTIHRQVDTVTSLDQDRILRAFLTLIQATLRTTFFQRGADGRPQPYLAVKLDPQAVPDLPAPRPSREIFVYSPRFEGVHLRFGAVARGGLRWSDRRDDLRPEILGLVKAQMVKNAVIVPTGAKGGFVLKRPLTGDREDTLRTEGVACYKLFVSALLDLTDNLEGGRVIPPRDVVRHDGDDPYLVVAADKGTASFSDFANEISEQYGYWLGDAFASGGSAGYDHKRMGITARGAWESVRRAFRELASGADQYGRELASGADQHGRELGVDIQTHDFSVVGVGDMSGDVFGNGMLLSRRVRLVAAFDHRHIFIDPTPDTETSYVERRRLYDLARSSWDDYDRSLISPGGGVWPRTTKSVPIAPQVRAALGLDGSVTALTPVELVRAILTAPVDLLWNGGIGTFVKAAAESSADVGDKTNDQVRVNGKELRCRVVCEGGNLGLTQAGRVEYALHGGLVNADFIDNSGGVDCSDHEVNIKILLTAATAHGELDRRGRDALLAEMTGEVGASVVRDSYLQACVLGSARARARALLPVHRRMVTELERRGLLDRALEGVPDDETLAARTAAGVGLRSPELAVLLAYTRIAVKREIVESPLCQEHWTADVLADYFPNPLRRYAGRMAGHPLARQIVTTQLVNEAVNRGGVSFFFRTSEETGASTADVLRGYVVARQVFGLDHVWQAIESLDNKVTIEVQTSMHLDVRRLLDKAVRWLVSNRPSPLDVAGEIERFQPRVQQLLPELGNLLRGRERQAWVDRQSTLHGQRVPDRVAYLITGMKYGFGLLDVVETGHATGLDLETVAHVYFVLSERFRVDDLLSKIAALPKENRWQTLARMALRYDLYAALAELTGQVLAVSPLEADPEAKVAEWEQANSASIVRLHHTIGEFADWPPDLAALSVLLRQIRTVVRTTTVP